MKSKIVVLLMIGFTVAAGVSSYYGQNRVALALQNAPVTTVINAKRVPLSTDDPMQTKVGELTYVAGWSMTSPNDDFGGWSGLLVDVLAPKTLLAISDKGYWLQADIDLNAKVPLLNATIRPFEDGARGKSKSDYDAESLARHASGLYVGLEQNHRILDVKTPGAPSSMAAINNHLDLSGLSSNGGLEALTRLDDGTFLMFAERGLDAKGTLPAWIASADKAETLRLSPPKNFAPTDAVTLPNGDVLLLMRYYSALDGSAAKLLRIAAADIKAGAVLKGTEIAHFSPPLIVDNMEALDIKVLADGTLRLFMMSDDNFSPFQRNLFLVFDWKQ
ncbi:MAG: esterase-like activity of phytase family protein [Kordiimonadaceae bacterium]|nr:esterase-like activity of phytase family protein [Kordiimonadaceae bacterium]